MKSVLIVENDVNVLEDISSIVEQCEYTIQSVNTYLEAMKVLVVSKVSTVLMNWDISPEEATELITEVRSNHRLRRTHIMVCSINRDPDFVSGIMNLGADDFLSKPLSPHEIRTRLGWATNKHELVS